MLTSRSDQFTTQTNAVRRSCTAVIDSAVARFFLVSDRRRRCLSCYRYRAEFGRAGHESDPTSGLDAGGDETGGKRPARRNRPRACSYPERAWRYRLTCRGTEGHHGWGCAGSFREGSCPPSRSAPAIMDGRRDAFVTEDPVSGRVVLTL
jgi:hypothetical protein